MKTMRLLGAASTAALLVLGTATLTGCSGGGGTSSGAGVVASTIHATGPGSPVAIADRWLAYLADEATTGGVGGTDLNGNAILPNNESVAVVVDVTTETTRVVPVQADDIALISTVGAGTHLFTVTDEAEDMTIDWNGGGFTDTVLLHSHLESASGPTFVATLDPAGPCLLVQVGERLYFKDVPPAPLVAPETSIAYVDAALAPTTLMRVNSFLLANTLEPTLIGQDEGLIFMTLDEAVEGRDLNNDTVNGDDGFVLALLDGTDVNGEIFEVPFALQDSGGPVRAIDVGVNDWLVGFFVDEAATLPSFAMGLNDPNTSGLHPTNWQPVQCTIDDTDAVDEVLHYLQFDGFTTTPANSPVINTGLVNSGAVDMDRLLGLWDGGVIAYLATVSAEADAGCDLNGDGPAMDDHVLRWVRVDLPVTLASQALPYTSAAEISAIEPVPGGPDGALAFANRFITVISEAKDSRQHDGDPADDDLVAWLDPFALVPTWVFDHSNPPTPPINAAGTGWMGSRPEGDVFGVAFPESFVGADVNGDGDMLDSLPSWASFSPGNTELDFPGVPAATDADNAGIDIAAGVAFYRVDEAADGRDWNGDNDFIDKVLFRTTAATGLNSFYIASLLDQPGPAIFRPPFGSGLEYAVAFLANEAIDGPGGVDFNNDGDFTDIVLRYVRLR
jgi:hypothetical protein